MVLQSAVEYRCIVIKELDPCPQHALGTPAVEGNSVPQGKLYGNGFFHWKAQQWGAYKSIHALSTGSFQEKIKCLLITKIFKYGSVQKSWATPDSLSFSYDIGCFFSHFQSIFTGTL